jgi:hypothetical protein
MDASQAAALLLPKEIYERATFALRICHYSSKGFTRAVQSQGIHLQLNISGSHRS